jgi:hypothetical protein
MVEFVDPMNLTANCYGDHLELASALVVASSDQAISPLQYYYHDMWQEAGDPRVTTLPLMAGGPWPVLGIIAFYVYFVKALGPDLMATRKAFSLKPLILLYNVAMVLVNGFFFYQVAMITNFGIKTWSCNPVQTNAEDPQFYFKLTVAWFFLMSKFVDLFDTVFFVLRKNFRQVSALHVIHHSLVPINVWLAMKYVPSESAAFMPFVNSFIHTVMYAYYGLSTLGPQVKPYLWWKKYLTTLQIIQLALIALHCAFLGFNASRCNLPKSFFYVALPQAVLFLYMFCTFFIRSYTLQPAANCAKLKEKTN